MSIDKGSSGRTLSRRHFLSKVASLPPIAAAAMVAESAFSGPRAAGMTQPTSDINNDLLIVDGHVHITTAVYIQGIDPWKVQTTGTFDYARAKLGGLNVAFENIYIDDKYDNYNYAVKQACRLIET